MRLLLAMAPLCVSRKVPPELIVMLGVVTSRGVIVLLLSIDSVPALTVVAPPYVFALVSVNVPLPSFVRAMSSLVPVMAPLTVTLPAPPKVRILLLLSPAPSVMLPPMVKVSASELIRWAPATSASVIVPAQLLLPLTLRRAPPLEIPLPLSDNASAPTAIPPCNSSAAPLLTVVPPAVVPRALVWLIFRTPALIVVAPV
jgi:hypothetical protein